MALELEKLAVKIEGDMAGLRAELGKANALMEKHSRDMSRGLGAIDKRFAAIGAVAKQALGVVSVGAFLSVTKQAMAYADTLVDVEAQTGLNVETIQELRFALAQVGLEQGSVDKALKKFTINVGNSITLGGEYTEILNQMGVQATDLSGNMRSTEDVLQDVFLALEKTESIAVRNALAYKLFGKEAGPAMAQAAAQGTAALNAQREMAQRMGAVMDKDMVKRTDQAADEMTALTKVLKTQSMVALADLSPALVAVAGAMARIVRLAGQASVGIRSMFGASPFPLQEEIEGIEKQITELQERIARGGKPTLAEMIGGQGVMEDLGALKQQLAGAQDLLEQTKKKQLELIEQQGKPPATGAGGTGIDPEAEAREKARDRELKRIESDFQRIESMTRSSFAALEAEYDQAIGVVQAAVDAGLRSREEGDRQLTLLDEQRLEKFRELMDKQNDEAKRAADEQKKIAEDLSKFEQAQQQARFDAGRDALINLSALMASESRKAFEIGKIAAIAETIVSTYAAAQKAYSAMAGIPYVGPALGIAAAAAAVAGGLARVQAIQNTQFGSRSVNVGVGGGLSVGSNPQNQQAGATGNVYIRLEGQELYTGDAIRQLIERINEAQGDGNRVTVLS